MQHDRVVAIDGPSASGKGTLARLIAAHYGWRYFDSGVLYRAVAWLYQKQGRKADDPSPEDWSSVVGQLDDSILGSEDLRRESVGQAASKIAVIPELRQALLNFQRQLSDGLFPMQWLVMDGRDIGTVVFPHAGIKFFVTASMEARAKRRSLEMESRGFDVVVDEMAREIHARDVRDASRVFSPLRPADDAIIIDTSFLLPEEAFAQAQALIDAALKKALTR